MLIGTFQSVDGSQIGIFPPATRVIFTSDGNVAANMTFGGTHDFFSMVGAIFEGGENRRYRWGAPYVDGVANFQAHCYSWLTGNPIMWTDGCLGEWYYPDDPGGLVGVEVPLHWLSLFYAPKPAV